MAIRKRPPASPRGEVHDEVRAFNVLLEEIRSQYQASGEALENVRVGLEQRIDEGRFENDRRFALLERAITSTRTGLELSVRELRVDVQSNGADIRELKVAVQQHAADVQELKTEVRHNTADVQELKTEVRQNGADMRDVRAEVGGLSEKVGALVGLAERVATLERADS